MRAYIAFLRWLRRHRGVRRGIWTTIALWFTLIGVGAGVAAADGFSGQASADPIISWMGLKDTHGVPIWAYQISGPTGGLDPRPTLWVSLTNLAFNSYLEITAYAIWFVDWINSFEWFTMLNEPAVSMGSKFQMLLGKLSLAQAFMVIAAVAALIHYGFGRKASAIYELFATWTIAALAAGALANPVGAVSGDGGWIMQTRGAALQMAGAMITPTEGDYVLDAKTGRIIDKPEVNVSADTQALQAQMTSTLVDVFVRQPAQLINYGRVLDGGACEQAYTDITKDGPYREDNVVMDKIADCDKTAAQFAKNPSPNQFLTALALLPASFALMVLAGAIAGGIMSATAIILFKAIAMLWSSLKALLPGGARMSFFNDLGEMIASFMLLWFSIFVLAVYCTLLTAVFKDGDPATLPKTFFMVDIFLVVLVWLYIKQKKRIKESAARIAQLLATRPGGSPAAGPTKSSWTAPAAATAAAMTARRMGRRHHGTGQGTQEDPDAVAGGDDNSRRTNVIFINGMGGGRGGAPRQRVNLVQNRTAGQAAKVRLAQIAQRTATRAALSYATGGVSSAAIAAVRTRQLALGARKTFALPGGPQRPALGPGPSPRPSAGPRPGSGSDGRAKPFSRMAGFFSRRRRPAGGFTDGYERITSSGGAAVFIPVDQAPASAPKVSRLRFRRGK